MKISLTQTFVNSDDTPAIDSVTNAPITLKQILTSSLLAGQDDKIKRYNLFRDIKKSKVGFVSLNVEDVAFLKKAVLEVQPTLVAGQAHEMLENEYISTAAERINEVMSTPPPPRHPRPIPTTNYKIVDGEPVFVSETRLDHDA